MWIESEVIAYRSKPGHGRRIRPGCVGNPVLTDNHVEVAGHALPFAPGLSFRRFGKIVTSLVNDIVMPPIGMLLGNVDFSRLSIVLREKTAEAEAITINYGAFINTVLDFVIVAFVIFLVIRQMNKMKRQEAPKPSTTKSCPFCMSVIDIKATRCPNCTSEIETEPA